MTGRCFECAAHISIASPDDDCPACGEQAGASCADCGVEFLQDSRRLYRCAPCHADHHRAVQRDKTATIAAMRGDYMRDRLAQEGF